MSRAKSARDMRHTHRFGLCVIGMFQYEGQGSRFLIALLLGMTKS